MFKNVIVTLFEASSIGFMCMVFRIFFHDKLYTVFNNWCNIVFFVDRTINYKIFMFKHFDL